MRKAFSLMEMVVVIVVLPVAFLMISGIFVTLMRDIPRDTRLLQENTSVLDMTDQIAEDMDRANGLPDSAGAARSDEQTLLIALPEGIACYRQVDGGVTRDMLEQANSDHTWQIPDAVVAWRRRQQDGRACALELETLLRRTDKDRWREKFANSRVFFIDGLGKAGEIE